VPAAKKKRDFRASPNELSHIKRVIGTVKGKGGVGKAEGSERKEYKVFWESHIGEIAKSTDFGCWQGSQSARKFRPPVIPG
jgi:hypothetical protein